MVLSPPLSAIGTERPAASPQKRAWATGQLRTLAWHGCRECVGTGGEEVGIACGCVWETIFRICYARYRRALNKLPNWTQLPRAEVIDFEKIAQRALSQIEWKAFQRHFLWGDDKQRVSAAVTVKVAQALFDHGVYCPRPR